MDGKLLQSMSVETKPSGLEYFNPYSMEEFRLTLPAGDHVFRAGFIDDPFVKTLAEEDYYSQKKNKYIDSITFVGPFATNEEPASRKKILRPGHGQGLRQPDHLASGAPRLQAPGD